MQSLVRKRPPSSRHWRASDRALGVELLEPRRLLAGDVSVDARPGENIVETAVFAGDNSANSRITASAPRSGAAWFTESTAAAGISRSSATYGVSWGDVNGDGWPDAFLSNHFLDPSLYVNQGDGTFIDEAANGHELLQAVVDSHGAAWGDYDNDGDKDLLLLNGGGQFTGEQPDTDFFINEGGALIRHDPQQTGLTYGFSDRTPAWIDINNDGLLDAIFASVTGKNPDYPSVVLVQTSPGHFEDQTDQLGLAGVGATFASLLSGPNSPEKPDIAFDTGSYFRWDGQTWANVSDAVFPAGSHPNAFDYAYGDVNGDGLTDLYLARMGALSDFLHDGDRMTLAYRSDQGIESSGIDFQGSGGLTFDFGNGLAQERMRLGAGQTIPTGGAGESLLLDSSQPEVQGEPTIPAPTAQPMTYIWYTSADQTWHFRITADRRITVDLDFRGEHPLTNPQLINVNLNSDGMPNELLLGTPGGAFQLAANSGLEVVGASSSAVMADMDNDMDLDVYVVNRGPITSPTNQLFENLGDGTFVEVPGGGGAPGSTVGSSDAVAVADYDRDGFLDLWLANGGTASRLPDRFGPHQLYKNLGNANHWLELDLEGMVSSKEAVGAVVEVLAGGVTQVRMQGGGMHRASQDHTRVHFGLGPNTSAEQVVVRWPSGIVQTLRDVPADQILLVRESGASLDNGVLLISGTEFDDAIDVRELAGQIRVRVNSPQPDVFFDAALVEHIEVRAGGGRDAVFVAADLAKPTTIWGGPGDDELRGGGGADEIFGGAGQDVIYGRGGLNLLRGEEGDDFLTGGPEADRIEDPFGHNTINGRGGDDVITTGDGDDIIVGGSGNDVINAGDGDNDVRGDAGSDVIRAGNGNDVLRGGSGGDFLDGGDGDDRIRGNAGPDVLLGQSGADDVAGGAGRDLVLGGAGPDALSGDDGFDVLIAGETIYDDDAPALALIRTEWTSSDSYASHVNNLRTSSGSLLGSGVLLQAGVTVMDDGQIDRLTGGAALDFFFADFDGVGGDDELVDRLASEALELL